MTRTGHADDCVAGPDGLPLMLDMRVIFMDVAVGRWGLPSVEMETLLWRSPNPV